MLAYLENTEEIIVDPIFLQSVLVYCSVTPAKLARSCRLACEAATTADSIQQELAW